MPSKDRDVDVDGRTREKRHRSKTERKDRDRDTSSTSHRHHSHKSSKSSRPRPSESEVTSHSSRRHRSKDVEEDGSRAGLDEVDEMTDLVPELGRGMSSDRISMPYPTFSKAHSKEFLHSKEDLSAPTARRTDPLTPEPTDLGSGDIRRSKSVDSPAASRKTSSSSRKERRDERPPTPPETDLSSQKKRSGGSSSVKEGDGDRPRSRTSWTSRSTSKNDAKSSKLSKSSSQATFIKSPAFKPPYFDNFDHAAARDADAGGDSRSAATSATTKRSVSGRASKLTPLEVDSSPESAPDSSPKTPTQTPQFPPNLDAKQNIGLDDPRNGSAPTSTPANDGGDPSTAPPPPPPLNIQEAPRVDYLMQNGGLPQPVPKNFLAVLPRQNGTRPSNPPLRGAETLFAPFFNLLNQYQTVLTGQGSVAVATGHRTIARRLLDRLENVFSRDLSPDGCPCIMCDLSGVPHRGLGWGEVLERASGRIDLPQWPPFDLASLGAKAVEDIADMPARPASPIKMDPDIAEEFREHYLRQSKKVRAAVDKWMSNCDKAPAPPPQEVDDETLTFAILTNLDQDDRPYFNSIISGSRELQPATRAPTPTRKPRNDFVVKTGLSLQRLYRLAQAPRDAETALYLVKNPSLHDLLHTISDINPSEWEILISGRFDGFLWSGADDDVHTPHADGNSRGATPSSGYFAAQRPSPISPGPGRLSGSRNNTPFSRGATPNSFVSGMSSASHGYQSRGAVSHDEETEIAVLAEVEREIFAGMEALEDAFESLHRKAELVRTSLRERAAGLSISLRHRRALIDVLPLSGSSGTYDRPAWAADEESMASESDWGGDDASELAPDDSASNISSSKHRRPKRRKERNTPAPIEEEEE